MLFKKKITTLYQISLICIIFINNARNVTILLEYNKNMLLLFLNGKKEIYSFKFKKFAEI